MILTEMPYIKKPNPEAPKKDMFDLEIENLNGSEILTFLTDIFNGKLEKDKYGNILQLKSREEKYLFAQDIKKHAFAYDMIKSKLTPIEIKKLDQILNI